MEIQPPPSYQFLFIMDPYPTLNLETETSLLLMGELLSLGHMVYWTEASQLILRQNRVFGITKRVHAVEPFLLASAEEEPLNRFDVVLMRNDPPFNVSYLHLTYMLDFLDSKVVQFNPARSVRNANEKLFALNWPEWVPPTITTMYAPALEAFLECHGKIVVKPIEDCSGRGIEFLNACQPDAHRRIAAVVTGSDGKGRFVTAQKFLEQVLEGDKRVYLVNGKPLGIVNRIPAVGSFLANIHQGARCMATELTNREEQIIQAIAPLLREMGLFLVGLDLIGELITEINLTSPSAVRQINQVMGKQIEKEIVVAMLEYVGAHQESVNQNAFRKSS